MCLAATSCPIKLGAMVPSLVSFMINMSGSPPADALLPTGVFAGAPTPPLAQPGDSQAPSPTVVRDEHDMEHEALLNSFVQTIQHFFGGITSIFAGVEDPRVAAKCDYPLSRPC